MYVHTIRWNGFLKYKHIKSSLNFIPSFLNQKMNAILPVITGLVEKIVIISLFKDCSFLCCLSRLTHLSTQEQVGYEYLHINEVIWKRRGGIGFYFNFHFSHFYLYSYKRFYFSFKIIYFRKCIFLFLNIT